MKKLPTSSRQEKKLLKQFKLGTIETMKNQKIATRLLEKAKNLIAAKESDESNKKKLDDSRPDRTKAKDAAQKATMSKQERPRKGKKGK